MSELNPTVLADKEAAGRLAPYSGAITATDFGDIDAEFRAITEGCGVYDLGWRGKLIFTGEDRVRWLNGVVTNNIRDLPANHGNYNFVLNAQGRIQGDLYIYNRGEYLLGDTEMWQTDPLMKLFEHFIIMDDVELTDASEKITSIGVQGPRAAEILKAIRIEPSCAEPLVVCDMEWRGAGISVTRMASDEYLTYEIWLAPQSVPALWEALVEAGATKTGTSALEMFRVMAGVPKYGQDIYERYLPQETGQVHALNFTKGCYLGQEIVERIRSRGQVHRGLTGFLLPDEVQRGAKVTVAGKDMGEITSVARVKMPRSGEERVLALGYLRREAGTPGTAIAVGDVEGTVAALPFKI